MTRVERPGPLPGEEPRARIEELWAWLSYDPMTGHEGIMAYKTGRGGAVPMVTTNHELAGRLGIVAREVAAHAQEPRPTVRLVRFVAAEDV